VHYAPHVLPDVATLECDLLACSTYKFYGPHGGVLWGKRALLDAIDAPRLEPAPQQAPERLETGTQNHEGIVGGAAAVDWLASLAGSQGSLRSRLEASYRDLHQRAGILFARLWQGLQRLDTVTLHGPPPDSPRTATVAFTVAGVAADRVAARLARRGCFVSHGDFYAATVIDRLGLGGDGLVRAGLAAYASAEEVDRLLEGVGSLTR